MLIELRSYQQDAVAAIREVFTRWRRVLFVLPSRARGIDIRTARGWQWFQLLQHADGDAARLRQIQVARGYKPGWVRYAVAEAAEKRAAAQRGAA
jgi:hypothetical protein